MEEKERGGNRGIEERRREKDRKYQCITFSNCKSVNTTGRASGRQLVQCWPALIGDGTLSSSCIYFSGHTSIRIGNGSTPSFHRCSEEDLHSGCLGWGLGCLIRHQEAKEGAAVPVSVVWSSGVITTAVEGETQYPVNSSLEAAGRGLEGRGSVLS